MSVLPAARQRRRDDNADRRTEPASRARSVAPRCEVQSRTTRFVCKIGFMDLSLPALE